MESGNPIELLKQLEVESLGDQLGRELQSPITTWQGFTFEVDGLDVTIPFIGDFEIIPFQEMTPLPMVQTWVRGMTNIRGEIFTVVDFSEFLGKKPTRTVKGCNLLLLPDGKLKAALLIGGRVSLKSFDSSLPEDDIENAFPGFKPYLSRIVQESERFWYVVDVAALCGNPQFTQIGRSY